MEMIVTALLGGVLIGGLVFCVLTVIAAWKFLSEERVSRPNSDTIPISVLTPLAGYDSGLDENLRSSFTQGYAPFEIIFAVRRADDPATAAVSKLMADYPQVRARLIITGEPMCANAKVFALSCMANAATYDVFLMVDSDVRMPADLLKRTAAYFSDPETGLVTCPYRAIPARHWWNVLEALGMNTQFLGGVLVARLLEGMKFALGPCLMVRRQALERLGGLDVLGEFLAEDFVMGKLVSEVGYRVLLSGWPVEHHIGGGSFRSNLAHRLRWARSTRRSRPKGYIGEVFTNPLPVVLVLVALNPQLWPLLIITLVFRAASYYAAAGWVLHDALSATYWWALPLQDLVAFVFWIAGFFGNRITWRGRRYKLTSDGRFQVIEDQQARLHRMI